MTCQVSKKVSNLVNDSLEQSGSADQGAWVREWEQTDTLEALRDLIDLGRRVTPAAARRAGIGHTEMSALEHLSRRPMGPAELAQLLGVTSAAASGVVDRLADRGHVARTPHPADGRRTEVHLTASGRREAIELLLPMFEEMAAADADLTEDERAAVLRYLQRMCRAMRRVL